MVNNIISNRNGLYASVPFSCIIHDRPRRCGLASALGCNLQLQSGEVSTLSGMLISLGRLKCAGVTGTDKRFSELSMNLLFTRRLHQLPAIRATCWKMRVPGNFKTGGRSSRVWPVMRAETTRSCAADCKGDGPFRMHALRFSKLWRGRIIMAKVPQIWKLTGFFTDITFTILQIIWFCHTVMQSWLD